MATVIKLSPINIGERQKVDIKPGDTVRVWQKIQEKGKTRLQAFEGLVIARKHGREPGATFTVRKVTSGVGVERIFPLYSPMIDKIEVTRRSKVRRAKLYYIRRKTAKQIRRKMKGLAEFVPVEYKEPVVESEEIDEKSEMAAQEEAKSSASAEAGDRPREKEQKEKGGVVSAKVEGEDSKQKT